MEWRTLFAVRPSFDGAQLDSCISWPRVEDAGRAGQAALVAARLEGKKLTPDQAMQEAYPQAWEAAKAFQFIELRARLGHSKGPYLMTTAEKPTDEEVLAWWEEHRDEVFKL